MTNEKTKLDKALQQAVTAAVDSQFTDAVKLRRRLHQCPELAFDELQTGKIIATELRKHGCRVKTKVGRTGVLGILTAGKGGPVVAVRSDMDALPVTEQTKLSFASRNKGVMHACGHDAHMSILVSTAATMAKLRREWSGTIKFIFQPSEEVCPGGALGMISDGVLKRPDVDLIFGLHVDPWIAVGRVGLKDGAMMAQADDFNLTVTGKSGHGARPHLGQDAIPIAAQIINAVQSIVSRSTDPLSPVVVSIGKITGGTARNVLAGDVRLEGTVRTLNPKDASRVRRQLEKIARGIARSLGGDIDLDYRVGYPVLVNHKSVNDIYRSTIRETYGARAIVEIKEPLMGGEDFAHYLNHVPGAMMRLGVRNPNIGATYAWHHPRFTIDEHSLSVGTSVLCGSLLRHLKGIKN